MYFDAAPGSRLNHDYTQYPLYSFGPRFFALSIIFLTSSAAATRALPNFSASLFLVVTHHRISLSPIAYDRP